MKVIYLLLFVFFNVNAQNDTIVNILDVISLNTIDLPPVFPGCENEIDKKLCFKNKLNDFLNENFVYPENAKEKRIEGKVNVEIIIETDGVITINGISGSHLWLKNDARMLFEKLPKMVSGGFHNNKLSRTNLIIPVVYNLDNEKKEIVPINFEIPPIPKGCENNSDMRMCFQQYLQNHIVKNFKYPNEAQNKSIQGKVFVSFIINEEGYTEVATVRGPHPILENEAKRIINLIPKMQPAKDKDNQPVKVTMSIPITFKLQEEVRKPNYYDFKRTY